jgi:integrating conjugative element protein (TIGR03758 family)
MSAMTDAYAAATGTDPARMGPLVQAVVCVVVLALFAYLVLHLWAAHQEGQLSPTTAKTYGIRAAVLVLMFLAVVLVWR